MTRSAGRLYGVLETTRRRRRNEDADEDGLYTGNRRYRNQAKEQPGVSPAIVSRLLDTTIFLSLKDLNLALPRIRRKSLPWICSMTRDSSITAWTAA